jgi:fumarate reductase flavoprotein subunit
MRARTLIMHNGRCTGVVVDHAPGQKHFSARAVVIADGGFQASPDLLRKWITPDPERVLMRNAGTGRGDGIRMALDAGAATRGLGGFYGHVQARDALTNPQLWPYPTVDMPISGGVVVNQEGHRFVDEGQGGVRVANAIAQQPDPLGTIAIFDDLVWRERACEFPVPANPFLVKAGATVHVADDWRALASVTGISETTFLDTVEAYNAALKHGKAGELTPPRSKHLWKPEPLINPPFYAVPLVAGITYTTGGIAIDGDARVVDSDCKAIEGLYAAGSCTGGHEGGPNAAYTGGLGKALTFGWIAGKNAAEFASRLAA